MDLGEIQLTKKATKAKAKIEKLPTFKAQVVTGYLRFEDEDSEDVVFRVGIENTWSEKMLWESALNVVMEQTGGKPVMVKVTIEPALEPGQEGIRCQGPEGPYCRTLNDRMAPLANATHKGFSQLLVTNENTDERTVIGVYYKLDFKDKGLMLNVCPWCGGNLAPKKGG
jgi:hypothetical protein